MVLEIYLSFPPNLGTEDKIKFVLHSPGEIPDLESQAVLLRPSTIYTFVLSPKEVFTEDRVENIARSSRQCLFSWESSELKLFRNYTQAGCLFECKLQKAERTCGCVPWDYPQLPEPALVCSKNGENCFQAEFSQLRVTDACDCPSSCTYTEYPYNYHVESIAESSELCKSDIIPKKHLAYYLLTGQRHKMQHWEIICQYYLSQKVSIVRVYVVSTSAGKTIRNKRMSLAGIIIIYI